MDCCEYKRVHSNVCTRVAHIERECSHRRAVSVHSFNVGRAHVIDNPPALARPSKCDVDVGGLSWDAVGLERCLEKGLSKIHVTDYM